MRGETSGVHEPRPVSGLRGPRLPPRRSLPELRPAPADLEAARGPLPSDPEPAPRGWFLGHPRADPGADCRRDRRLLVDALMRTNAAS